MTGRERINPDLIDLASTRRLVPDDLARALDGVGIVDALAALADSEHGDPAV
jgi:hypothetical protein